MGKNIEIIDEDYIKGIIEHNPIEKYSTITDKACHGISLDIWEKVFKEMNFKYKRGKFRYLGSNREGEKIELIFENNT